MMLSVLHLKDGSHAFTETVHFEDIDFYRKEIFREAVEVQVRMEKFENTISSTVSFQTTGHFTCDRCLDEYEAPVSGEFPMVIQLGDRAVETDEENVLQLPADAVEVDLADWIIEYMILSIPMKLVCREECKGLCVGCGANLNEETCQCEETHSDPRWEKLKEFRN